VARSASGPSWATVAAMEPSGASEPFNVVMNDFDQFVATHVDDLLRTAYLIVGDEAEAEDLVQECLLKVARRWPRVRRMDQPRAYARRILVNLAVDGARGRARRRSELVPEAAASLSSVDPLPALDARAELLQALAELPPCSSCAISTT
jgi:RNA polymerase sigma factor (sigma-70 family)